MCNGARRGASPLRSGSPFICDATPHVTDGETAGLLRVGDADVALDPLSSSGGQAAIQSALAAGYWRPPKTARPPWSSGEVVRLHGCCSIVVGRSSSIRRLSRVTQIVSGPSDASRHRSRPLLRRLRHCRTQTSLSACRKACGSSLPLPDRFLREAVGMHRPRQSSRIRRFCCGRSCCTFAPAGKGSRASEGVILLMAWSTSVPPNEARSLLTWAWRLGINWQVRLARKSHAKAEVWLAEGVSIIGSFGSSECSASPITAGGKSRRKNGAVAVFGCIQCSEI
jgi:hypothetical protein